ncbi:Sel1 repeat-containing protein 1 [Elsinoe australis]|uniref:Sel1 repeat-containing protein 1 n=1 Tax=Elsinoe australis TaxID=40998 RepID=A0A4U7B3T3_9PEZI|nr:Sel1 repeat-containing protein 1 [Elsinoe australis]
MTLRDLLKKKHDIEKNASKGNRKSLEEKAVPYQTEFTFLRTTTSDQEVIQPPTFPGDQEKQPSKSVTPNDSANLNPKTRRRSLFSHKPSTTHNGPPLPSIYNDGHAQPTKDGLSTSPPSSRPKSERKLSDRFGQLRLSSRSTSRESVSSVLPASLDPAPSPLPAPLTPDASKKANPIDEVVVKQEAQWEARAAALALSTAVTSTADRAPSPNPTHATTTTLNTLAGQMGSVAGSSAPGTASSSRTVEEQKSDEETLHNAISLHEAGDLSQSTALFGRLASPSGANMALAQVLYGLALRHGWGCDVDPPTAVHFLSLAAKNSASIETQALKAGMHKGGAAKGELVLAIFELANCYRYGWGVGKDSRAAREFYETAANLGDLDAMEEAAWCFLEGFGGGKDRFVAAQYLRRAEQGGRKRVGESWIWKEKYNPKT